MLELAAEIGLIVASGIISLGFVYALVLVQMRMKAGAAKDMAVELLIAAQIGVRSVEQVLKPVVLAAAKDGELSRSDYETLRNAAVKATIEQLSEHARKRVGELVIERAVEAQVLVTKPATKEES